MPPPTLTPAQIALQAERKAAKQAKKAAAQALAKENGTAPIVIDDAERARFLRRDWANVKRHVVSEGSETRGPRSKVRIVTWNILAQTLVRRELFPGSDCLRWSDRRPMLLAELASFNTTDFICLQECDRLSDLAPSLPSHSSVSTKGRNKLHGLVIFYREARYRLIAERTVYLDEEDLSLVNSSNGLSELDEREKRRRRGGSRQTKNVGLIAAFEEIEGGSSSTARERRGLVIATTHLFWHPKFAYERVRQMIILLRAIKRFKLDHDCVPWQTVLAGDLNIQPFEATYQLLTSPNTPLHPALVDQIESSRIVHTSVDKISTLIPSVQTSSDENVPAARINADPSIRAAMESTSGTGVNTPTEKDDDEGEGEGGGEGGEPDSSEKSIANTRSPQPSDGILTVNELVSLVKDALPEGKAVTSAYGVASTTMNSSATGNAEVVDCVKTESFGNRGGLDLLDGQGEGRNEPAYTCYTPLFKLTLDYLFLFPGSEYAITELLRPARTSELGEGLPRKGITASDHLAVGVGFQY